jgi:hypothetical protein
MNVELLKAINDSGVPKEVIAAVQLISSNRASPTPTVLVAFVGYAEPATAVTDTVRNNYILGMLAHYSLDT